jgi:hypothetical protein
MIPSIPFRFYFMFWLRNSLAALGLGLILGLFAIYLFELMGLSGRGSAIIYVSTLALILLFAQLSIFKHFYGKERGKFEYVYRERLISKEGNRLLLKEIGKAKFVRLFIEELSDFSDIREDIYKDLLGRQEISDGLRFYICLKMAKSSLRHFNFSKEIEWLKMALALSPDDLVANFRLAAALEQAADGDGAISRYGKISQDCHIETFELKNFIGEQIARVKMYGSSERPPMVGLRYMQF